MNLDAIMARLKELGVEKIREMNVRDGADDKQFGVKMGDLRILAKSIKTNPELATELWDTGNSDAMLLAILLMNPKKIAAEDLEKMVMVATYRQVAEWLTSYMVKQHPQKEALRQKWMQSTDTMLSRAGWSLTAERIAKNPEGLDVVALLDRIEAEMGDAPASLQWTMNYALAETGINFPELRERAVAIGEKLGVFRDYPTSKGCTSPFAPIWIAEMVKRQEE